MVYENYSVLMSVYYKEKAEHLKQSIESMLKQTKLTNDFVIVCDGPLTDGLDETINYYFKEYPDLFNVVRLSENRGLGLALNEGILHCKNEIIARMDSDDLSMPSRCEVELDYLNKNQNVDVISTGLYEFVGNEDNIVSSRVLPEDYSKIRKFAKFRCPVNHATVMYKKSKLQQVDCYDKFLLFEDYELWIKMLNNNMVINNLSECLYLVRSDFDMYKRRGGKVYFKRMIDFRKWMKQEKYINLFEYIFVVVVSGSVIILPEQLRKIFYKVFLRKKIKK